MKSYQQTQIKNLGETELLALLSSASVIRKTKYFDFILKHLLLKNAPKKKIYEALLQTYLFAGFPSALISLKNFNKIVSAEKNYDGYDLHNYTKRGLNNCRIIYGEKFDKLIANIKDFSPEMAEWLIVEGYGKVLGRKGLSLKEREVCIISILAALKFKDQLYSHINGLVRLKVKSNSIKRIFDNLSLISANSTAKFGVKTLIEYQNRKSK